MVINPSSLGLEALLPSNTETYQQLVKLQQDLSATHDDLLEKTGVFNNAHRLYNRSLKAPVCYSVAMHQLNLKDPEELLNVYRSVESAYDDSLRWYDLCVDRFVQFCRKNMSDEKYKLAYEQAIRDVKKQQHMIQFLDPRDMGTEQYEPVILDHIDTVSMEGFFKNIKNRLKYFYTNNAKVKAMHDEIVKTAKGASQEAEEKFKAYEHGFKCPTHETASKVCKELIPSMKWIVDAAKHITKENPKTNEQDVAGEAKTRTNRLVLADVMKHFLQGSEGKSTYGDLGYTIKGTVALMEQFLQVAGQKDILFKIDSFLGDEIIEDKFKGDGSKQATLEQMLTSLETCFDAYDRLDYTLYRIGKDIKQVLK